ncbi:TRAP transporter small permease [Primorskyibacter aestuariivivens]|uniref:TRAP transporter small permease n=1 Tax=Primorskyibacter aestuariivivens TaxID=1888912 RepID=UPI0023015F65|nr:TRAP transporter small permease [Primorskyibacter aestuariivivens]MDA7430608.1 TRAP transporter small permease [Primorskyibacter aestuariivivens]
MSHSHATSEAKMGENIILIAIITMSKVAGWVSAGMIVAAVITTCHMIFIRFVLNQSTTWQTEAVVYLVIGATLVGLAFVQSVRGHVNVDLIPLALGKRLRKLLAVFTLAASMIVVAAMCWYSYEHWHLAFERGWRSDTVWGVQLWIPYLALPVGFGLLSLQLLADLIGLLLGIDKLFGLEE